MKSRKVDVFFEGMGVLIENKSRGADLDASEQRGKNKHGNPRTVTPCEQAKRYADNAASRSIAPKWIVTTNFGCIRIYGLDDEDEQRSLTQGCRYL